MTNFTDWGYPFYTEDGEITVEINDSLLCRDGTGEIYLAEKDLVAMLEMLKRDK